LARSDKEFTYFNDMDKTRYEYEKKFYGDKFNLNINYRLMDEEEVPKYIKEMVKRVKNPPMLKERVRPNLDHLGVSSDEEEIPNRKR